MPPKTFTAQARLSAGTIFAAFMLSSVAASAAVLTYTDQSAFESVFGANIFTEDFNGAASDFGADSTGNPIGSGITVDVNGPADGSSDTGPTGLTGKGQFEAEVDFLSDILSIDLNFAAPLIGFGFVIQNDSQSDASGLDLEEIGVLVGGESFILSDILGLTNSSDGKLVSTVENSGPQFFGFTSDIAFSAFTFVHGDDVAPGGVSGSSEEFFLNSTILVPEVAAVPLPAGGFLLISGLAGIAALRRHKKRVAQHVSP